MAKSITNDPAEPEWLPDLVDFFAEQRKSADCVNCGTISWSLDFNVPKTSIVVSGPNQVHPISILYMICERCGNIELISERVFTEWQKSRQPT
jgi:hypothetical protein